MVNGSQQQKKARKQAAAAARRKAARRRATIKFVAIVAVLALIVLGLGSVFLFNGSSNSASTTTTTTAATPLPCPQADGTSAKTVTFPAAPANCLTSGKKYTATFDTSEGAVVVALDTDKTPATTNNFVYLSNYHYYDATQIFRTDTSIDIIQGGSPHTEDNQDAGPGYTINDEGTGYKYAAGDLVMARSSGLNSAGAQFFFVTGDKASALNTQGTYVTFGHTTSGLDVLQKIIGLNVDDTTGSGLGGKPSHTVTINSVKITES